MKLVLATPLYPPEPGGPATYARILETGLPDTGIQVEIVKFRDVRALPKLLRHAAYFWKTYTAARGAQAILALDPVSVGLPALLASKLRGIPFIAKVVGDYAWEQGVQRYGITASLDEFVENRQVPVSVRILRAVQTCVAREAAYVLVPSVYLKGIVTSWGIPKEKIRVIYNSIQLPEKGTLSELVASLPRPRIATIGRLVPWKHVDGVITAVRAITSASLVVVGDGPERERLEKMAKHSTLFTGALSHTETLAILEDADILVLNSSYEGLSHLLIEALMLGKVIIATDVGGNPELITHEVNGLLIPVGDTAHLTESIERITCDPGLAKQLSEGAKASSVRFTTGAMLEQTAELLKSV